MDELALESRPSAVNVAQKDHICTPEHISSTVVGWRCSKSRQHMPHTEMLIKFTLFSLWRVSLVEKIALESHPGAAKSARQGYVGVIG